MSLVLIICVQDFYSRVYLHANMETFLAMVFIYFYICLSSGYTELSGQQSGLVCKTHPRPLYKVTSSPFYSSSFHRRRTKPHLSAKATRLDCLGWVVIDQGVVRSRVQGSGAFQK